MRSGTHHYSSGGPGLSRRYGRDPIGAHPESGAPYLSARRSNRRTISSLMRRLLRIATNTSAGSDWVGTLTPGTPIPLRRLESPTPLSSSLGGRSEALARYHAGSTRAATSAMSADAPASAAILRQRRRNRSQSTPSSNVRSSDSPTPFWPPPGTSGSPSVNGRDRPPRGLISLSSGTRRLRFG